MGDLQDPTDGGTVPYKAIFWLDIPWNIDLTMKETPGPHGPRSEVYAVYHMGSAVAEKSIKLVPGHGYSVLQAVSMPFTGDLMVI